MADRLTDEQVAWYAGTSRTAKWTADMAVHENIVTLAREVQAHRSACECAPVAEYVSDELHATLWLDEDGNPLHVMRFGERFSPVEMQAIRKALQAAETVIAHADDPARQQTKIEYLSWALVDLSDAVQAWVLEGEQ